MGCAYLHNRPSTYYVAIGCIILPHSYFYHDIFHRSGFPCDLSLLHLCTALMVPAANWNSLADNEAEDASDSLVHLISELITALPYLTEPFTAELQRMVQQAPASLYPQLDRGDQAIHSSNVFALTQSRTLLGVDWKQRSGSAGDRNRYASPSSLYAGIRLIAGTRGKVEPGNNHFSFVFVLLCPIFIFIYLLFSISLY